MSETKFEFDYLDEFGLDIKSQPGFVRLCLFWASALSLEMLYAGGVKDEIQRGRPEDAEGDLAEYYKYDAAAEAVFRVLWTEVGEVDPQAALVKLFEYAVAWQRDQATRIYGLTLAQGCFLQSAADLTQGLTQIADSTADTREVVEAFLTNAKECEDLMDEVFGDFTATCEWPTYVCQTLEPDFGK